MKQLRKVFISLMAVLLVTSNLQFAVGGANAEGTSDLGIKTDLTTADSDKGVNVSDEELLNSFYNENDQVRVLVEMEEKPGVFHAMQAGVKYDELPSSEQQSLHEEAVQVQSAVQSNIKSQGVSIDVIHNFTAVTNGFSAEITFGDIETIENTAGVKMVHVVNEYERPEAELDMSYSKGMINAQKTWDNYDYTGEGLVIGIIDTGIDPWHRDMEVTEGTELKIDKELVESLDVPGKWFTDKVPYGYNYMDRNNEILDPFSHHGMHVGGTAAANGDEGDGGIKGVAPDAQLLALKVFGNDPTFGSTYGDVYVKAMDDALKLGVDVLNLSLGSVAGFVSPHDPEQQAVKRAQESGVVVSISAGNSAHFANGFAKAPYASNPDIGVTGSPSVSYESIGVASSENDYMAMDALVANSSSYPEELLPFLVSGTTDPITLDGELEVVYAGLGYEEEYEGLDVEGKVALVQRGEFAFVDKGLNAQANGAAAVIIFNNVSGYVNMQDDPAIEIPYLFMDKSSGEFLRDLSENEEENLTISFNGDETIALNPEAGAMSDFTSWGLAPNLDFKPEITAPGGNILSTLQDNKYGLMSGTSMAAPHVAGGAALILERVDEEFGLEGADRSLLAKKLLMNTAKPKQDIGFANAALGWENSFSPRRQGAGEMDLHAASSTPAYAVNPVDGEAKVALREISDEVSFELEVTNFSDDEVTYDIETQLLTDFVDPFFEGEYYLGFNVHELEAVEILNAPFTASVDGAEVGSITIPEGTSVTVEFDIDLSEGIVAYGGESLEVLFENGYFAEGFVSFVDPQDTHPTLSVPFVGFNGDWGEVPILDEPLYEEGSFYEVANLLYSEDGGYYHLGFKPGPGLEGAGERHAFSPELTSITPYLSFLRNASEVQYSILDADENHLRTIYTQSNVRKNFFDRGLGVAAQIIGSAAWDGTVRNNVVEDGLYYYEVKAVADFEGAEWQSFKFPVLVDTVAPEVTSEFDEETNTLSWSATDDHSGLRHFEVLLDGGNIFGEGQVIPVNDQNEYAIEFTALPEVATFTVKAYDNAQNAGEAVQVIGDTENPLMFIDEPSHRGIYDSLEVPLSGYVENATEIAEFTVNGQDVELEHSEVANRYYFDTTFTVESDGVYDIPFNIKDVAGNDTSLSRSVIVDTTPAEVSVVESPEETFDPQATFTFDVKDNFDRIRVLVDGDEFYHQPFGGAFEQREFEKEFEVTVDLDYGINEFDIEVHDIAGNVTEETVTIERPAVDRIAGHTRFDTAVEVSQEGWDSADKVILTRADDFTDALSGAPLAQKYDAPILLTQTDSLPQATIDEIDRLGATEVVILGGHLAVDDSVEEELETLVPTVNRIAGQTRWETSAMIAEMVAPDGTDEAVVVYGHDFPDALAIAPYAAAQGMPILLTDNETLPSETADVLESLNVETTYALGGHLVMSEEVFEALPGGERIGGQTRLDTAMMVVEQFDPGADHFYVATVEDHNDALAGAALAGKQDTGILLVGDSVHDELETYVTENGITTLTVLGGELAVSADLYEELRNLFAQ
ncbi:S8 family serine peptidase [Bacillus shivajii]|uniref:cell wall-binding repeat-containing protein n=1 Tax=Bacillus shivajii TaxID=1983719 RepID=UPI001CFBAFAB|nr:cell wall-binding repeat-containing protein [Bacillus shivajii]UCZ52974.1 S8 family serine peptidase [Bacillus shivajii]